jgi:hypothetical protein
MDVVSFPAADRTVRSPNRHGPDTSFGFKLKRRMTGVALKQKVFLPRQLLDVTGQVRVQLAKRRRENRPQFIDQEIWRPAVQGIPPGEQTLRI